MYRKQPGKVCGESGGRKERGEEVCVCERGGGEGGGSRVGKQGRREEGWGGGGGGGGVGKVEGRLLTVKLNAYPVTGTTGDVWDLV